MNIREYEAMYLQEESHWWYVGMRAILFSLLPPSLLPSSPRCLDAGCGTGYTTVWLRAQYGSQVTGLDYYPHGFPFCRKRDDGDLVQGSVTDLPFAPNTFDLVVCLDVVSQVQESGARLRTLREIFHVLKPGGFALIRVPACELLKSSHDADVWTYHRYGSKELKEVVRRQGFHLVRFTFANALLFPLAIVWRVLKKAGLAPSGSDVTPTTRGAGWFNTLMKGILHLEAALLRFDKFSFPLGLSLIAVACKPRDGQANAIGFRK